MNQELENYSSTTPIDEELKGRFKVLRIVAFMRWITLLAGPAAILIDDYIKNIREWTAAGGISIHHTDVGKTISELKRLGFK